MGHKVTPLSNRLGFTENWTSRWFSLRRSFGSLLAEDVQIRRHLKAALENAAVAKIEIERTASRVRVIIHSARPGIVIGRRGADIDRLRDELNEMTGREIVIDIKELNNPAIEPQLVAENIAFQLKRQVSFRRAMKRAVQLAMNSGAKGIKVRCAGRLGGAEMSRVESYREGKIPLGTFRANIDFGFAEAKTTYGIIGVKSWIYQGETLTPSQPAPIKAQTARAAPVASPQPGSAAPAKPASSEPSGPGGPG